MTEIQDPKDKRLKAVIKKYKGLDGSEFIEIRSQFCYDSINSVMAFVEEIYNAMRNVCAE